MGHYGPPWKYSQGRALPGQKGGRGDFPKIDLAKGRPILAKLATKYKFLVKIYTQSAILGALLFLRRLTRSVF